MLLTICIKWGKLRVRIQNQSIVSSALSSFANFNLYLESMDILRWQNIPSLECSSGIFRVILGEFWADILQKAQRKWSDFSVLVNVLHPGRRVSERANYKKLPTRVLGVYHLPPTRWKPRTAHCVVEGLDTESWWSESSEPEVWKVGAQGQKIHALAKQASVDFLSLHVSHSRWVFTRLDGGHHIERVTYFTDLWRNCI